MRTLSLFQKPIQLTGKVWEMDKHNGWGNSISFSHTFADRRIVGWTNPLPEEGDELHVKMQSGNTARFVIVNIEYCGDPRDMWFADIKDIGYIGEKPMIKIRETK